MQRNIVTAFMSVIGRRIAVAVVGVIATPILVRILGAGGYGTYATIMALFSLVAVLTTSSVNNGVRKYLADERPKEDWQRHVFAYHARLTVIVGLSAAALLIIVTHIGLLGRVFGSQYESYVYLLAALVVGWQFRGFVLKTLMGLKLEHISEPLSVGYKVLFSVVAIGLALNYGVAGVIAGDIIASAALIVVGAGFVARHVPLSSLTESVPHSFPQREMLEFNSLTVVHTFLMVSLYHVDVLMLNTFVGNEQTGYYKAALVLVAFLWLAPRSIESVMLQSTAGLWERERTDRINVLASRTTRYALVLTLLLAIGMGALAGKFVPLYYGSDFTPTVEPLLLLLPGTVGVAVARPILSISQAKGDLRIIVAMTTVAAVLNLALNAFLIPEYGTLGAATATSIGYGSLPLCQIVAARRLGYRPFADARIGRIVLTTVGAGVPIVILGTVLTPDILALVVVPPIGLVLYAVATFATGAVRIEEVAEIVDSLPLPQTLRRQVAGLYRLLSGS